MRLASVRIFGVALWAATMLLLLASPGQALANNGRSPSAWTPGVAIDLATAEYRFSWGSEDRLTAPNRAHGLRSVIAADGWHLRPRVDGDAWELHLRLTGVGRGTTLGAPEAGRLRADGPRAEIVRPGLTEWYVNARNGIEQGFTLETRPAGELAGPLTLALAVEGSLIAEMDDDARGLLFSEPAGRRVMRYAELYVVDATGRSLEAWFELSPEQLRIVVDDSEAVYPVIVDPLASAADWFAEQNQVDALMGLGVTGGDFNNDGYDDVVIGADEYDNGEVSEGIVLVYYGSEFGPSVTPSWTAESNLLAADFGTSVAAADVNGDLFDDLIVGAVDFSNGESDEGAVFVWFGSAAGLGDLGFPGNADWRAECNQLNGNCGIVVASAGDVNGDGFDDILVGADEFTNGQSFEGSVFGWYGSAGGLGPNGTPENADWRVEPNRVDSDFGFAVDSAGDVNNDGYDDVVIGAWNFDENRLDEGQAYVYLGSAAGLATTPHWVVEGEQDFAEFGVAVSKAGDVNGDGFDDVLIGASEFDNGETNEGGVFLFLGSAAGLSEVPGWLGESNQGSSDYGFSISGGGDVNGDGFDDFVVGASTFDNGELDEGRMMVYLGSPNGPARVPTHIAESDQLNALYGLGTSIDGDFNGDGLRDVLIGASRYDKPELDEGVVFLYLGCIDLDSDAICEDGDMSGVQGDNPCTGGAVTFCDDNCPSVANTDQVDSDLDGDGDRCDTCTDMDGDTICEEEIVLVQGQGTGEQVLIDFHAPMRYLANVSADPALGTTWAAPAFDDASWTSGQYGVGYESQVGAQSLIFSGVPVGTFSVYTRTTFEIPNVADVENMFLGFDYDDGVIAWVNGVEVYRSPQMPSGPPTWNTHASTHESSNGLGPDFGQLNEVTFPGVGALVNGTNVLAVGVWNSGAPGSSDLVVVPRLSINRGSEFNMLYIANTSDPGIGMDWVNPGFVDSAWNGGNYGVGYEAGFGADELINTTVPVGALSVYTRISFNVARSAVRNLAVSADYDDGYVIWLNGTEVYRSPEMPGGALAWNTAAASRESSNAALPVYGPSTDISGSALPVLQDGKNRLAIGIWNDGAPAGDDLVLVPRIAANGGAIDNCLGVPNPDQADNDGDGAGDLCDDDDDDDTVLDVNDNCQFTANMLQEDSDGDLKGDACDVCPNDPNDDSDGDGYCVGSGFAAPKIGGLDNCPVDANPDQADLNGDGEGDACDIDVDGDDVDNELDNCPRVANTDQANGDGDPNGDLCDCSAADDQNWQVSDPVLTLALGHVVGGDSTLVWNPPAVLGSVAVTYDTLRAGTANGFAAATCLDTAAVDLTTPDGLTPGLGSVLYYLVRVENGCPGGAVVAPATSGPRTVANCP